MVQKSKGNVSSIILSMQYQFFKYAIFAKNQAIYDRDSSRQLQKFTKNSLKQIQQLYRWIIIDKRYQQNSMSVHSNKIPTFLKRKTQKFTKDMFQVNSPRGQRHTNEFSSFRYLSPRSKDSTCPESFEFAKAIRTTNEGRMILLNQENQRLLKQLAELRKQKYQVQQENSFLKNQLKTYSEQLNNLKSTSFTSPTCHSRIIQKQELSTAEFSYFNGDGMSILNEQKTDRAETSVQLDEVNAQLLENSRALAFQNQILQQKLNTANQSMSKMKRQFQSAQINLRVMQRKLMAKQKELKIEKAKSREVIHQKQIFDLSDDQ